MSAPSIKESVKEKPEDVEQGSNNVPILPSQAVIDARLERKTIRKVDWRLIPILSLLFGFSLIDRNNLGIIRVAGMDKALGLSIGERFSVVTVVFFVPLIIFELPANIYIRKVGPRAFLSVTAFCWGVICMCSGFVKSWQSLAVLRVLLGIFESGFLPSCAYLISLWYTRGEVQTRMAFFYSFSLLAAGFSAILGYGFAQMHGRGGIAGWAWIYIMEGIITIIISVAAWFLIVDFPDQNKFLSPEETELVKSRIDIDRGDAEYDSLNWDKFWTYTKEPKLWAFAFLFMCSSIPSYAIVTFLPVILAGMKYSVRDSQLLVAPPFACALIFMLILARISDKVKMRAPFMIFQAIVCMTGLIMIGWCKGNAARYAGAFLGFSGASANVASVLAYQSNNIIGQSKRSYASALSVSFGGIGGIYASTVFRQSDFPIYREGCIATITTQVFMVALILACTYFFNKRNQEVRKGSSKWIEGRSGFFYIL